MTEAEKRLWSVLRDKRLAGTKFRRQQEIGPYIVDFVCQRCKLVVEADGGQHAASLSDANRDAFLQSRGYAVLRFWNNEILRNTDGVLTALVERLAAYPSPTSTRQRAAKSSYPLPQGERNGELISSPLEGEDSAACVAPAALAQLGEGARGTQHG